MAIFIFANVKLSFLFTISFFLSINSELIHDLTGACYTGDDYKYNFHRNNTRANIDKAITYLKSKASNTYYSTISTGSGLDKFNALFSCRYDVSHQTCRSCVTSAADIVFSCLPNKQSSRYFEECTLYYSNSSISFSSMEDYLGLESAYSGRTVAAKEESNYNQILYNTVTNLIGNVISEYNVSSRYFATTTANYSSHETLYALGQCNPDITSLNCSSCLQRSFDRFTSTLTNEHGVAWAQILSPICRLSYTFSNKELSRPWIFTTYMTSSTGKRGNPTIGAIIGSILSVTLLLKPLL